VLDGVALELLLRTILLKPHCQETVLLSPVTKVVDPDRAKAEELVQVGNEVADDGGAEVTGVERFRNVWGAELDNNLLTLA